jgi:polyisoprenoid-binding protein YceI
MKVKVKYVAVAFAVFAACAEADTWRADPDHTEVRAYWDHSGFSEQSLEFTKFDGSLQFSLDAVPQSNAFFSIPVSSIATGVAQLDKDLLGPTFFDVENYPNISFQSSSFRQVGPMKVIVTGDLTIKDVTREATFDVMVLNLGEHPVGRFYKPFQGTWLGVFAVATIKRSDWGMGAFVPIGSDEIRIEINSELKAEN